MQKEAGTDQPPCYWAKGKPAETQRQGSNDNSDNSPCLKKELTQLWDSGFYLLALPTLQVATLATYENPFLSI